MIIVPGFSSVRYWILLRKSGIRHSSGSASAIICLSRSVSFGSGRPDTMTGVQPLTTTLTAKAIPRKNALVFMPTLLVSNGLDFGYHNARRFNQSYHRNGTPKWALAKWARDG